MKILKYILPPVIVGLLIAAGATALSVSLPATIHKGDLLVGSSTNSSLYNLSTGSPGSVLYISPTTGLPAYTATSTLGISGGTANVSPILANGTVAGVNATSSTVSFNVQGTGALNPFNVASSSGTSELFVGSNGNVGIGTASPSAKLEIDGNDQSVIALRQNNNSAYGTDLYLNQSTGWFGINTVNGGVEATALSVDRTTGNVGIGTTTPAYPLVVSGHQSKIFITGDDSSGDSYSSSLYIGDTNSTHGAQLIWDNNASQFILQTGFESWPINFQASADIFSIGTTEKMRVAANGNLGIGTTTPGNALTVVGSIQQTTATSSFAAFDATGKLIATTTPSGGSGFTNVATGTSGSIFNVSTTTSTITLNLPFASASNTGQLQSADWTTFNNKQAAGNYITALTGDLTASGPGSVAATLATVNSNTGTFGGASSIPSFTVNGKGLITAASANTPSIPVGDITGVLPVANGGTGAPSLTAADVLFGNGTNAVATSSGFTFSSNILTTPAITLSNLTGTQCLHEVSGVVSGTGSDCGAGGGGNSAWTIGNGLIYNATSTDSVLIGTTTPTTATHFIEGSGTKNPLVVASSSGASILQVTAAGSVLFGQASSTNANLVLYNSSNGYTVTLKATSSITSSFTLTLPNSAGSAGQVLTTDGSGNLSWQGGQSATGTLDSAFYNPADPSQFYDHIDGATAGFNRAGGWNYQVQSGGAGTSGYGQYYAKSAVISPAIGNSTANPLYWTYPYGGTNGYIYDYWSGTTPAWMYGTVNIGYNDNNLVAYIGLDSNGSGDPGTGSFIGCRKIGGADWYAVIRTSGTDTVTADTGYASDNNAHRIQYDNGLNGPVANSVSCSIDGAHRATASGTIPSTGGGWVWINGGYSTSTNATMDWFSSTLWFRDLPIN